MRHSSVLFVTPHARGRFFGGVRPPVGIAYVEEFARRNGIETDSLDMTVGYTKRHLFARIAKMKPALAGFSVMTYQYEVTFALMRAIKTHFPDIRIVAGGPHISAFGSEVLNQCEAIDYAIAGEGEIAIRDLCFGIPLESIPGMSYRQNGAIKEGPPKQTIMDLEALPFPRFDTYPLARYTDEIEINTSRGCPYGCIFCAVSNIMGARMRFRSVSSVGEELEYFYTQGRRKFQFGDDNFLADRQRVLSIVAEIKRRKLTGLTLRCGQGIRADLLDRELLIAMRGIGFRQIGIGVESASERILKVIRKGTAVEKIEQAIKTACELGFDVSLLFVVGTPGETLEDVETSITLARKYPVMKSFFFNLIPFPGTRLYDWVVEHNAFLDSWQVLFNRADEMKLRSRPFFETAEMPERDRIQALKRTEEVSKEIQVATLRRKLAPLGCIGNMLAQIGYFSWMERKVIGTKLPRRLLDFIVFGRSARLSHPAAMARRDVQR
jgi:Fe-S oxidoreductase